MPWKKARAGNYLTSVPEKRPYVGINRQKQNIMDCKTGGFELVKKYCVILVQNLNLHETSTQKIIIVQQLIKMFFVQFIRFQHK